MTSYKAALSNALVFCKRHERVLLAGIFTLGLLIRLPWLGSDFTVTADLPILREWSASLQQEGLVAFYGKTGVRAYPPVSTYLFAGAGWLSAKLSNSAVPNESLLNALIKLPAILADLATAALLVRQAAKQTAVWRILAATLYLFNPAVWYVSVYWGQTDAIYVFSLIAALMLLAHGVVMPAWVYYCLSLGVKLQGLPLLFLFFVWTVVYNGRRALVKGLAAAGVTALVLISPWLLNGRLIELARATISRSSRVVQSAYNGWYFILGERAGMAGASQAPGFPPISYQIISLFLFLMVVLFVTILTIRRREQLSLPVTAVVLTLAAFLFLTDIHERYLFPVLPLLLWAASQRRRLLWLYLILTVTWFFNLVTIASFAPDLWTNLVAWKRPYPLHIELLKDAAWVVSAVHLTIFIWLSHFLIAKSYPPKLST
ncbi:MAG: hypothetical protein WAM60_12725 [Candidatus Promineifilaceae bacterium]